MGKLKIQCPSAMAVFLVLSLVPAAHGGAGTPLVIAWQAPPGPSAPNFNTNLYNSPTCAPTGPGITQFACFTKAVLPNISGIGIVVPWGMIDNCAANTSTTDLPCQPDSICHPTSNPTTDTCYNWAWIDSVLWDYVNSTSLGPLGTGTWYNSCAGGRPCKVVVIIWLTQDSGGTNLFGSTPNTPAYVFTKTYANSVYAGSGCGTSCPPQDVLVCSDWQGGGNTGWGGPPPITDTCWASGGNDYGLWNANDAYPLQTVGTCMTLTHGGGYKNYSGYPVMYEKPILTAAENFIDALALHYSSACPNTNAYSCGGPLTANGPTIAKSIAYMRIGPSSGGEDYPYCSSDAPAVYNPATGCPVAGAFWSGPQGFALEPQCFSDQGYLTSWPSAMNDGPGYISSLYKHISQQNWAFPITTPSHQGPPNNGSIQYADTEALLANQYGLGMGMQAASVGDLLTYAVQHSPSTSGNWAVHFREFPYVPVHHLQTQTPGTPSQAGQFSITNVSTGSSSSTATVYCGSPDCYNVCNTLAWVFIGATNIPAFNGIQEVDTSTCNPTSGSFNIIGPNLYPTSTTSGSGFLYSGVHLPVLLPFESQQCQGSLLTICSAELWEETLDWTYGTNTVLNTAGNPASGDTTYQTAISNFLAGMPSATSMHSHMSTNASHY